MILVSANNLKKTFSGEDLFSGISFSVDSADKIGFVGINGAGKSTLFKLITGEYTPDDGEIFISKNTKIGYLTQHACSESEKTVFDEVLEVFKFLCAQGDALAHSCVVGAPFTDVILGSIVVPAYKVELLCPAFSILRKNAQMFLNFILEFCHFFLSFLLLVDFI